VNSTEIIPRKMQADSGFQVRQLFAESIWKARESAKLHPHGKVLPFNKAGRNVVRVGITFDEPWI
jgi:hypothetical protein